MKAEKWKLKGLCEHLVEEPVGASRFNRQKLARTNRNVLVKNWVDEREGRTAAKTSNVRTHWTKEKR